VAPTSAETIRLLVISREDALLHPLSLIGKSNPWQVEAATSGWEAMERVQSESAPHLLLLDLPPGEKDSLHLLRWLRRLRPELPVIVTCHLEDENKKKEAIRLGAEEVLMRPFDEKQLEAAIRRHLDAPLGGHEVEIASDDVESVGEDEFFLSASPVMQKLRAQAELLAQADVPVLILGEPGSGKRTVARLIHKLSLHSEFPFLRVNCAAMPSELLDAELFGRAHVSKDGQMHLSPGKLQLGEKGTLLLEEITEMPLGLQSRLLQVLQDRHFFRSGEERPVQVDVRILATSCARLDQAIEEKKLREDLYYRLSAFTVHVPALRKRREEIKTLLHYTMHKLARYYGLPTIEFSQTAIDACLTYSWPGNMQEMESFVKRYLVAGDEELSFGKSEHSGGSDAGNGHSHAVKMPVESHPQEGTAAPSLKSLIQSVKSEAERNAIAAALEKTGWNRKAAARLLRVSYRTLLYKIDHYHMSAPQTYVGGYSYPGNNGAGKESKRH
jgi:two-component system, NtrC family, response regulator AtoC